MARRAPIWLILVVTGELLATACGGNSYGDGPTASRPTVPPPTTNPYAVPEVIDVAYVNRVLAGLDQAMGDIIRIMVAARAVTPEAVERMEAIFDDPANPDGLLQLAIEIFQIGMREDFAGYRANPGNDVTTVTDLISATPTCIFAKVDQDYSAISNRPPPRVRKHWVGLVPLDPANDPQHSNPTRWVYAVNGVSPEQSQPRNPCAAAS